MIETLAVAGEIPGTDKSCDVRPAVVTAGGVPIVTHYGGLFFGILLHF